MQRLTLGILLMFFFFALSVHGQKNFDNYLTFPPFESGYSRQTRADQIVYENYTQNNQIQQRWQILGVRPLPANGKLTFSDAWKSVFPEYPAEAAIPRYRRLYTDQSIQYFAGGIKMDPVDGLGYSWLAAIPVSDKLWQPVVIWAIDEKTARPLTYTWIEQLQGVKIRGIK